MNAIAEAHLEQSSLCETMQQPALELESEEIFSGQRSTGESLSSQNEELWRTFVIFNFSDPVPGRATLGHVAGSIPRPLCEELAGYVRWFFGFLSQSRNTRMRVFTKSLHPVKDQPGRTMSTVKHVKHSSVVFSHRPTSSSGRLVGAGVCTRWTQLESVRDPTSCRPAHTQLSQLALDPPVWWQPFKTLRPHWHSAPPSISTCRPLFLYLFELTFCLLTMCLNPDLVRQKSFN